MLMIGFEGTTLTPDLQELIRTIRPCGVILFGRNITDAAQLRQLTGDLQEFALQETGNRLLIAVDQEGGQVVRLPWLDDRVSQAGISDAGLAYDIGLTRGRAMAELGINLNLAPVLDMAQPGDFLTRYGRVFPGNPEQVGELGKSLIAGQKDGGILSTAKHFPGYVGISFDPELERLAVLPEVPEISQFIAAADAQPELVMTANVIYRDIDPNLPLSLSPAGISFLHSQLPGEYLVITDDLATKVLKEAYTLERAVISAAQAGVDILLVSGHDAGDQMAAYNALSRALQDGELSQEQVERAVARIATLLKGLR
jgi:beta-N-acetylhexosaminidase